MTTDLERDSASYDRIRRWLSRTLEGDSVDRLLIRHDTGAEVATMRTCSAPLRRTVSV